MLDKAIKLAAEIHEGQKDKGGEHYILHAIAVMNLVSLEGVGREYYEQIRCAAVLHDTLEDFDGKKQDKLYLEEVIKDEFGQRVFQAVRHLTKPKQQPYDEYIEYLSGDWIATRVKIADLTHNMDPSRLPRGEIKEYDFERWDKYRRALTKLKGKSK